MNWLILSFIIQLGYTPHTEMIMYQPPLRISNITQQILVDADIEALLFHLFYIGVNIGIPMWKAEDLVFWPSELQSEIRAGVRLARGIEIGWSHLCSHPVIPYLPGSGTQVLWEGCSDEIHLKISGEVKF